MAREISDNVAFLQEAKAVLKQLNEVKEQNQRLELEGKKLEKALSAERKAVIDSINITIRKRKEEINGSYDKEINRTQEQLKKARVRREKEKTKGIKNRIAEETADLREENRRLKTELKTMFRQSNIPAFCNSRYYYALYFTKGFTEFLLLLITFAVCFLAVPCGIYFLLPERRSWHLILIYLVVTVVVFGVYTLVNNLTKARHLSVLQEGRKIRNVVVSNNRRIRAITNAIEKDKNEGYYHLDEYDRSIAELELELEDIGLKKQDALTNFERQTRPLIEQEIAAGSETKIGELQNRLNETQENQRQTDALVKQLTITLTDEYGAYIGMDFLQPEKLDKLISILQEGLAANITEAKEIYGVYQSKRPDETE